jgi:hypothetical protein
MRSMTDSEITPVVTEPQTKKVSFPPSALLPEQNTEVKCQTSIVVVGANGSGKSRLGTWLEFKGPQKERVHRIAAQRSLVFPENSSPIGFEKARDSFYWAPPPPNWDREQYERGKPQLRLQHRYGGSVLNAETAPLSDFEALVTLLFSENYTALLSHEEQQRKSQELIPMPDTLIRKVQALWENLLPSRALIFKSSEVQVSQRELPDEVYSARAMSDGERVIFYLIGQCLCAPDDSIIVVDEPEIHLHKAIQNLLWDSLERARPDCIYVYLTHDLSFAADRIGSTKICISEFRNAEFSWYAIPDQREIPEDVFLELLGSRKPVLFVEGTSGSHDSALYRHAFPGFTVKPVGSCSAVVNATKVFRSLEDMHHIKSFGIVDRDYLEQGQIDAYERAGVFVPLVAEVENLFLVPELVKAVSQQLVIDPEKAFNDVSTFVFEEFTRWLPTHAMELTKYRVSLELGRLSSCSSDIAHFSQEFKVFQDRIYPESIYAAALAEAQAAISAGDYSLALRLFNKKDLTKNLSRFFGITRGTYVEKVLEMAKRNLGCVPQHLQNYLPDINACL